MREERAIDLCKGDVSTSLNMTAMKRGSFGGEEWAIELCKGDSSTALRMTGKMRVGWRVKTFLDMRKGQQEEGEVRGQS